MARRPIRWRLEVYETLGSTSDRCIERAKAGEPEGLAILAHEQTAGRGRRGRQWQSPPGNLNLSVLLRPGSPASESSYFPLLTGVALADAISAFLPQETAPMLKWPNDVLLGCAKVAGILIDAAPLAKRLDWVVIGIGINLTHAPEIAGKRTTTLKDHGGVASPEAATQMLLHYLDFWLEQFTAAGAACILDAWRQRAHPIDTELTVQASGMEIVGRYAGLSPKGELLLHAGNRIERFQTGEIFLKVEG